MGIQSLKLAVIAMALCVSCLSASEAVLNALVPIEVSEFDSGMEGVDCVYVINLKERPAKWEILRNELESQGIQPNRVNAINGWKLDKSVIKSVLAPRCKIPLGQLGCFLTHISVWKDAIDRDWDAIWVLEDDVVFLKPISQLEICLNELKLIDPDWDILHTDPDYRCPHSGEIITKPVFHLNHPSVISKDLNYYHVREVVSDHLVRTYGRWGTYSMIISRTGLQKLFNNALINRIFSNVDHQIHTSVKDLRGYVPREAIATHEVTGISDTSSAPR